MPASSKLLKFLLRFIASGFFISYLPTAILKNRKNTSAGFWGTLLGLLSILPLATNKPGYLLLMAIFLPAAVWICDKVHFNGKKHDDPKIILDEIVGFWFAVAFLPKSPLVLFSCFVLFRFFDTLKPFFIKKLDNLKGGLAVVADDVASGIITNLVMQIALIVIHYYNVK